MKTRINFDRIFGKTISEEDYEKHKAMLARVIESQSWTARLLSIFTCLLEEYSPKWWAQQAGITYTEAVQEFDHAYRTLKLMFEKGWLTDEVED